MGTSDMASIIDFTSYITERTRDFTGREWVFQAIQAWLADAHGPRFFLLTGDPGSGKSAIAARLAQFSQGSIASPNGCHLLAPNFLSALHFCSALDGRWKNPTVFAESLALQLAARYQPFAEALIEKREGPPINIEATLSATTMTGGQMVGVIINKLVLSAPSAEDAFTHVVREPLEVQLDQEPDQQVIIMVDALDEALTYSGDTNIVSLLAHVEYLPPGARFILTSRKVEEIELAFRNATRFFLSSERFKAQNQEDIDHFVAGQLLRNEQLATKINTLPPERGENLRTEITKKAAGNFLYIRFLLDAIAGGKRPLAELEGLPEGLDGLYFDSLERIVKLGKHRWHEEYAPLMGVLSVVQESVTQTQLAALTGQAESDIWEYLGDVEQFLEQVGTSAKGGEKRYRLYHQSVIDFLNQQWLVVDHEEKRNGYYCSIKEWHRKVANRCEQGDIMCIWEEERHDLVEQCRREYARKYYITHLYLAQAWQRLFEVLDAVQYGRAKLRNDPSTRSYALDLDLGRQATMWEGWTIDEGMSLLPRLWQYTLLRCSLTSRADRYPEAAFRLLVLLGRKQEALGLAELLTDPTRKVHVLLHIAEQLRQQASQGSEWLELLMSAVDVARTIRDSYQQAEELSALGTALAQAQQWEHASQVWEQAEHIIGQITDSSAQARALSALGTALAQAQQWTEAEHVIGTITDSEEQDRALSALGTALAQAGQWAEAERVIGTITIRSAQAGAWRALSSAFAQAGQWAEAERVIGTITNRSAQAGALSALSIAFAQAGQEKQASQVWARAERVISTIADSYRQVRALSAMGTAFAQAGQGEQASQVWAEAERVIGTITNRSAQIEALSALGSAVAQAGQRAQAEHVIGTITNRSLQARALRELGSALAQAGQEKQALQVWARAERVIGTITDHSDQAEALSALGTALAQAGQWTEAERVISAIKDRSAQANALSALGIALAQAQQMEQASQVWTEAERVISTIEDRSAQTWPLSTLGTALTQAGQWTEAERVISAIEDRSAQANALRNLATVMAQTDKLEQFVHLIQYAWQQAKTREEALALFSIASSVISRKPEIGILFIGAFTWVNKFLGG